MSPSPAGSSTSSLRAILGHFPTGVAVVTGAGDGSGPVGLTIQSFMALSLEPSLILVSIDRESTSWPAIAAGGHFAVNILAAGQQDIAVAFARSGGPKFDGIDWATGESSGAPLIAGCQAWVECVTWRTYDGGDHEIVAAQVLALRACDDPQSHPLVFFRSKFPQLDREHWTALNN